MCVRRAAPHARCEAVIVISKSSIHAGTVKIGALALAGVALAALFYRPLLEVLGALAGAVTIAFVLAPLCDWLQKPRSMPRAAAVSAAFLLVIAALAGAAVLLLPPLAGQASSLGALLSRSMDMARGALSRINAYLDGRSLPPLDLSKLNWQSIWGGASYLLGGTGRVAGGVMNGIGRLGFSATLAFFMLLNWNGVLFRAELLIPSRARALVLKMAMEIARELRAYIRAQFLIALVVGALCFVCFAFIGLPGAPLLGVSVGLFNLIPYFGPVIGGIPAVLLALGQDLRSALLTMGSIFVVQQLDGFWISPRIMSGVSGLSPLPVLLSIMIGGSISGITGMFFAIPFLLIARICLRVWASRNEMIEKRAEV